jgi:NADH:ubiquinone oxidoreductase subunit
VIKISYLQVYSGYVHGQKGSLQRQVRMLVIYHPSASAVSLPRSKTPWLPRHNLTCFYPSKCHYNPHRLQLTGINHYNACLKDARDPQHHPINFGIWPRISFIILSLCSTQLRNSKRRLMFGQNGIAVRSRLIPDIFCSWIS